MEQPSSPNYMAIILGGGLRLLGEDHFIRELAPILKFTRRGFRSLCRQLGVPLIYTASGVLVDHATFTLCLKAACRPGAPDFAMPGVHPTDLHKGVRNNIPTEELERVTPAVQDMLIQSRRLHTMDRNHLQTMKKKLETDILGPELERRRRLSKSEKP